MKKAAAAVAAMASKSTIGTRTSGGTAGSGKKDFQAYLLEKDKKLLNERIRTMKPVRGAPTPVPSENRRFREAMSKRALGG